MVYDVDYIATLGRSVSRKSGSPLPKSSAGTRRLHDRLAAENRELREGLVERHVAAVTAEDALRPTTEELEATRATLAEREADLAEIRASLTLPPPS